MEGVSRASRSERREGVCAWWRRTDGDVQSSAACSRAEADGSCWVLMCSRAFVAHTRAHARVYACVYDGYTALIWAAREGHADAVELLVKAGADLTAQDNVSVGVIAREERHHNRGRWRIRVDRW